MCQQVPEQQGTTRPEPCKYLSAWKEERLLRGLFYSAHMPDSSRSCKGGWDGNGELRHLSKMPGQSNLAAEIQVSDFDILMDSVVSFWRV